MPTDQDIREICQRVTIARDDQSFTNALIELKIAIRERLADAENPGIEFSKMPKQ